MHTEGIATMAGMGEGADRHDTVGKVKGFLHAVAMVDVDVYIQDPLIRLEQLEAGQDNVVDVAEPRGFRLLGMVHATCSKAGKDKC